MNSFIFEKKWLSRAMPLLMAVITFVVFLPSLKNGFVNWDDIQNLFENQNYRGLGWGQLEWMFTTFHMGPYQPLSWMTLGFDYLVWGMNPFGYHLTNIVLHSINASIFYLLCVQLLTAAFRFSPGQKEPELYISAGFAALFFAIHPLRVESVTWITERRDVLSGLFYLLAILWYMAPRPAERETVPLWRRNLPSLAAFLLSLLSKGMAVSLPLSLILLDVYPLRRLSSDPRQWRTGNAGKIWLEKIPFLIFAAAFGTIGYIGQVKAGTMLPGQALSLVIRAGQAAFASFFYIWKTLVPLHLLPAYRLAAGFSLTNGPFLIAGLALAIITTTLIIMRRRWPWAAGVWIFYLVTLAPVAGIVKFGEQFAADRYTYLPTLGFAVLLGAGFLKNSEIPNRLFRGASFMLICLTLLTLGSLTRRQQRFWHDSETLWNYTLAINPNIDVAHNDLGLALYERGNTVEAIGHYLEAIRLNPGYAGARYNLGSALAAQGKFTDAVNHYREVLRTNPDFAPAHNNIGLALATQGKLEEAAEHYLKALQINPDLDEAHNNLGNLLLQQGKLEPAIQQYREALRTVPGSAQLHSNLGSALAALGRSGEAIAHYIEALRIDPDLAQAHYNLAYDLAARGDLDQAAAHYRETLRVNPNFTPARKNLYDLLVRQGKPQEARACLEIH